MASYPGSFAFYINPSGTNLLSSPDHAGMHTSENNEIVALETFLGTNSGTNVFTGYLAGQFPFPVNAGGTLQTIINNGTFNSLKGGTFTGNIQQNGTFTNGVYNNGTFGTSQWTGGTIAPAVVLGSVIGSVNILDGNVPERKIRMDQLATGTFVSFTGTSQALAGITGGSAVINFNVPSNAMIYCSMICTCNGGGGMLFALFNNGTKDTVWTDGGGWASTPGATGLISFSAWRTGFGSGLGTIQMQYRVTAGTITISAFELIVQPFSQ